MMKPLPEHVTRAEAAAALRLSLRQVDRLTKSGAPKKTMLSASRSGFNREGFDQYLAGRTDLCLSEQIAQPGEQGYYSQLQIMTLALPPDAPLTSSEAAPLVDRFLATHLPGCLVCVKDGDLQIWWNTILGYTPEQILETMKR